MSLVLATIAALASATPMQSVDRTGPCTSRVERPERYRQGRYRVTRYYFEYRNTCSKPIRLHHCNITINDARQCALAMFQGVELAPGQTVDLRGPEGSFVHVIECQPGEALSQSMSRVTGTGSLQCASNVIASAAPEANPGAAFSATGDVVDLTFPRATIRPGPGPITSDDYPPSMLRIGAEGRSVVALAISPTGRATGCKVIQSSGFSELDRATCTAAMRRGRFTPAKDASGNPVASVLPEFKMAWVMP